MYNIQLLHQKFVVVADLLTDEPLELFYDVTLPSMHIEIFAVAEKKWEAQGRSVYCRGGGMLAIIDSYAVFYAKSGHYGRYMDEDVLKTASLHPEISSRNLIVITKAGEQDPFAVIKYFSK